MPDAKGSVSRVTEIGGRAATVLEHASLRVMIDDIGGMIPEFSGNRDNGWINSHWMPWFRSNSGNPYNDAAHGSFWKSNLLYHMAGSFPCIPNFGPGHIIDGIHMPPHGWTANREWRYVTNDSDEASEALWTLSVMESPDKAMPLSFSKIDAIIPGQSVLYTSVRVRNRGSSDIEICAAWHNVIGSPLLYPGSHISGAATRWMTPPPGSEFDTTSQLALGAEFGSLARAPLLRGGKTDLSVVPSPSGYTDFAAGAIPKTEVTGWLSLVNPYLKMLYMSFFTGPAAAGDDDIILYFNNLWMQYGGRPFTPWAPYEGGPDISCCLGLENSLSAFTNGLEYSQNQKTLMGNPVTTVIPAMGQKTLRYGTLFAACEGIDGGVNSVSAEEKRLVVKGNGDAFFPADPGFTVLKALESRHV
ncbi:MAG: hypothetical protein LBI67_07590 [Treponema sp.]|nr:hypothetical protein [Treponema sp.]